MKKFKKKPIIIDAKQWFKDGDHPEVNRIPYAGYRICSQCKTKMALHGKIETLEGKHIVCPNDWIIKGINGEYYPCKPDIFEKTYDRIEE